MLKEDIENLLKEWEKITYKLNNTKEMPTLLYKNNDILKRLLTDLVEKEIRMITVNTKSLKEKVERLIKQKDIKINLDYDLTLKEDIELQIKKSENRKIWLKCGGFITIDKAEALTAIDVNSGKYTGNKEAEATVYKVNCEATTEIAKQIKSRDIGGIIIIDYIDMKENKSKEKIERLLKEELKKDRSKTQVLGFTKLNLLEMTRKHINNLT